MKGLFPLFFGLFGTFAFSWLGLAVIPNFQIGHLDPQMDEEGGDVYPAPKSGMAERGRRVYIGNGCFYCHSQQVRADYVASDIERKWGKRRSAPRDYIFEQPALIGKMRSGPDLSNVGARAPVENESAAAPGASPGASPGTSPGAAAPATSPGALPAAVATTAPASAPSPSPSASSPLDSETKSGEPAPYSAAWHHRHLYAPRSVIFDSNMPAYRYLYEKRRISGEPSADALKLSHSDAAPAGWEIIPTSDAKCLVAYLMSLDQSHPLKEVKSFSAAPAPSPAAPASPSPAAPAPPPK